MFENQKHTYLVTKANVKFLSNEAHLNVSI